MKAAMKAQNPTKVGTLRMLLAEIKKREIDKKSPLETAEIHKTISNMLKQRQDSIEAFTKGNRPELAEQEKIEAEMLKFYLPQQMSHGEVEALVVEAIAETKASGASGIGIVMKAVLAKAAGRADGKLINEIARGKLTSP